MQQPHDIHEDWIEFFNKDSAQPNQERYHEYILRKLRELKENGKS